MPPVLISPRENILKDIYWLTSRVSRFSQAHLGSAASPLGLSVWPLPVLCSVFGFFLDKALLISASISKHCFFSLAISWCWDDTLMLSGPLLAYPPVFLLHLLTRTTLSLAYTLFDLVWALTTGIYLHCKLTHHDKSLPSGVR